MGNVFADFYTKSFKEEIARDIYRDYKLGLINKKELTKKLQRIGWLDKDGNKIYK